MIEIFHDPKHGDISGYRYWLEHNPNGYVLDRHRAGTNFGGLLHKVSCTQYLWPAGNLAGALSTGRYKACSNDRDALLRWAEYIHPNPPERPELCTACEP